MAVVYRVQDWDIHFENNRTRQLKHMAWVPISNKMDGDGYTQLVDHDNGAAHLGAWLAIVEVASKCDPRGTLVRDGGRPHDEASLSRITRLPGKVFTEALPRLLEIGWIVVCEQEKPNGDIPALGCGESAPKCAEPTMEQNRTEGKGTELNGTELTDGVAPALRAGAPTPNNSAPDSALGGPSGAHEKPSKILDSKKKARDAEPTPPIRFVMIDGKETPVYASKADYEEAPK